MADTATDQGNIEITVDAPSPSNSTGPNTEISNAKSDGTTPTATTTTTTTPPTAITTTTPTATATSKPEVSQQTPSSSKTPVKKKTRPSVTVKEPTPEPRYEILSVEEKHGPLHRAIPCMPLPLAIICLIFNIFCPGLGTFISAFTVFCCGTTRIVKNINAFFLNILSAVLQAVTFLLIVGWIWSILWGMTFVQLSKYGSETRLSEDDIESVGQFLEEKLDAKARSVNKPR